MELASFKQLLERYGIDPETAYQDLSEIGAPLWHGEDLGLSITCAVDGNPKLSIVAMHGDKRYDSFEADLENFTRADILDFVRFIREHEVIVRDILLRSEDACPIKIAARSWNFEKVVD